MAVQLLDHLALEGIDFDRAGSMNPRGSPARQQLQQVLVGVDGNPGSRLGGLVQACGVRRADFDPGAQGSGQVANGKRRFVRVGQPAARELDALRELEKYASTRAQRYSADSDGWRATVNDSVS